MFSLPFRWELQEPPVFGGNSQPAPHPQENMWIYFLFIPNPTKAQVLCSLECVKCPTMFFLTFGGNFLGLPLFPSPFALPLPMQCCPGLSCLCPVPQLPAVLCAKLLLIVLIRIYKNMSPEEQGCPHRGRGFSAVLWEGWLPGCPGHLRGADTSRGVLTMSLPHWQFRV